MWIKYKDDEDKTKENLVLASFLDPSSRCRDIFGDTGQLIDNAIFLDSELLLVNFQAIKSYSFFQDLYWTLMSTHG